MARSLTVEALSAATGVTVRSIRGYQTAGLLPASERRGRTAYYGEEHELRLREIRRLRREGFGLDAIRRRLDGDDATQPSVAGGGGEEIADLHREVVEALVRVEAAVERMGDHLRSAASGPEAAEAARRLRERAADWAAGASEARELDRRRARRQTPAQRIGEGLELARVAEKAQGGRPAA